MKMFCTTYDAEKFCELYPLEPTSFKYKPLIIAGTADENVPLKLSTDFYDEVVIINKASHGQT